MQRDCLWKIPDSPPPNPDCFVIPSYALRDRTRPTRPTIAQIELAFEWWKRFPQTKLIMSTKASGACYTGDAGQALFELAESSPGRSA